MSSLTIGGPRWFPAFDASTVGIGQSERARPLPDHSRGRQVDGSDAKPEDEGEDTRDPQRRRPEAARPGGAPDPSGNAGRRLDAFA
ncbi:MAG: hypothetical protein IT200_17670 [Thermoleophilia bacterium]|nr:hypothetical protein [Thermoleophilia bacterium]